MEKGAIHKDTPVPLYYQLKQLIREEIQRGAYAPDMPIPGENELVESYGISRTTVRQAITELVHEGWLYRQRGKGTFVAGRKISQDFIRYLETFNTQIARTGSVPRTEVLALEIVRADGEAAEALGLPEGSRLIRLFRRRFADGQPIVTVLTYLPADRCGVLFERSMSRESLYEVLADDSRTRVCRVTRVIEAEAADAEDERLLSTRRGAPILLSHTRGYTQDETPIEYSIARYRGDSTRFEVDVRAHPGEQEDDNENHHCP